MSSQVTPKKNAAFITYTSLPSVASADIFQSNPTLASGDAKVSIDGGAFNDLATLPDVDPNSGVAVKVALSSSEMNGDNIQVWLHDAAGGEWKDVFINIQTTANQIDDLALASATTTIAAAIAALNNLSSAQVASLLTATVADSVPADGTRPSIASGILMITRLLMEASAAGLVLTVNKEDGTTPSMTFALNSATDPTSITRAT